MRYMKTLGFATAGLGLLAAGCAQQGPTDQAMTTMPVRDTGSMQIPETSMGNLRQGSVGPGTFQASSAGSDTGSMAIPEHSMGNLRRSPPMGPAGSVRASTAALDTGSMQIPEISMGNLRRPGTTR